VLVTAVLMPLVLAVGVPASGEPLDDTADLVRLAQQFRCPARPALSGAALVQACCSTSSCRSWRSCPSSAR
jgi:hypothetical protein